MQDADFNLETKRLTLRPLGDTDVASLVRHWGDGEVGRYLWNDQPVTYDMVSDVVTTSDRDFRRTGYGIWAMRLRGEEMLIGMCGLRQVRDRDWTELLYSLKPRYWKQGFASEAVGAVLKYAFDGLGLDEVVASFDQENTASANVLRRHGLVSLTTVETDTGTLEYWHVTRARYGQWSVAASMPPASAH